MKRSAIIISLTIFLGFFRSAEAQVVVDTICASAFASYSVKSNPGSTYIWKVECGMIVGANHLDSVQVHWCTKPGTYKIKVVEMNKFGCIGDTVTGLVVIKAKTKIKVSGPKEICQGEFFMLEAEGADKIIWSNGQVGHRIFVQASVSQKYTAYGWDGRCFQDSASHFVNVLPKPFADFVYESRSPYVSDTVKFKFTGKGGKELRWTIDDTLQNGNPLNLQWIFHTPGQKDVKLVVGNGIGCYDSVTYKVFVRLKARVFVPNVFTPNGDEVNDQFRVVTHGIGKIKVQIFNRWGEMVFETDRLDESWDGTFKGADVQEGEYIYTIQAQDLEYKWHYFNGGFYVLR